MSESKIDKINKHPRVCCIDIEQEITDSLAHSGYNVVLGSFGSKVETPPMNSHFPGSYRIIRPGFKFPQNTHEIDVYIFDLDYDNIISQDLNSQEPDDIYLHHSGSNLPTFNPRPFNSYLFKQTIDLSEGVPKIVIAFTAPAHFFNYTGQVNTQDSINKIDVKECSIYSFANVPLLKPKSGEEMVVVSYQQSNLNSLSILIEHNLKNARYNQTFNHPYAWSKSEKNNIPDPTFAPLIKNSNDDIVSFIQRIGDTFWIFVPQIQSKNNFINSFLEEIGPQLLPQAFPNSEKHKWKEEERYWLPNHKELIVEKRQIEKDFKSQIEQNQKKITQNRAKFSFLHDILTETGDKLVEAIINYLHWLGFENAVNADKIEDENGLLEEDIQIELEDGLLIIECKGIGGTSTDAECSQISKIKYRRAEARGKFDVSALYIVNNQRHLPPLQRTNPPFKPEQIKDAINAKRGLLSTWQLFNLYFDIEASIIMKEEARKQFLKYGLVEFQPLNLVKIGEPEEILKNGKVCIIDELDTELKRGDTIFVEKYGRFNKTIIKGIQVNSKPVEKIESGEVGLELDIQIKKKSVLWIREN